MKQCPECNRNYADQTPSFCLQDGENREGFIPMLDVDPRFDPLPDEPRLQALIKKIGF